MERSPVSRVIGYNLLVLIICIAAIELGFGGWIRSDVWRGLNILRDVTYRFDVNHLYPRAEPIVYRRDVYGLRGVETAPTDIQLLTVGGSTTDQRYIGEGETWQDVLRHDLQREGKTIAIANAGMDGQSSAGIAANFSAWFPQIPELHPRYILLYNGINDLFSERSAYDDVEGKRTLKGMIRAKSALYRLYKTLQGALLAHYRYPVSHRAVDFAAIRWTDQPLHRDYEPLLAERREQYAQRLRILADRIGAMGARPIFVTQTSSKFRTLPDGRVVGDAAPIPYAGTSINGVDLYYLLDGMNQATLETCQAVGGICCDLAREVVFADGDFYDFFHNTPSGTAKIGQYLAAQLADRFDSSVTAK